MKLRGKFLLRRIMDDIVAVPAGQTALRFNGMIVLNAVSEVIWKCLEDSADLQTLVSAVTERFEVSAEEAQADILDFLDQLRRAELLDET